MKKVKKITKAPRNKEKRPAKASKMPVKQSASKSFVKGNKASPKPTSKGTLKKRASKSTINKIFDKYGIAIRETATGTEIYIKG